MSKYKIVRYYITGRKRTIKRDVTIEEAKAHCKDPASRKDSVYFDGYTEDTLVFSTKS
jgi:hypothetical protein